VKNRTSDQKVLRGFQEFGAHMQIIAILSVLSFLFPFAGLIMLIFILLALADIKKIYYEMPNVDLMEFRSKSIISFITGLLGMFMIAIGIVTVVLSFFRYDFMYDFEFFFPSMIPIIVMFFIGLIVLLISGIVQYNAWNSLSRFFNENKDLFPQSIGDDAVKGSNNIKNGIILTMTLILAIIGIILIIIGYFRLASLKRCNDEYRQPIIVQQQVVSPYNQTQVIQAIPKIQIREKNFCYKCGTKIEDIASFCPMCGVSLNR